MFLTATKFPFGFPPTKRSGFSEPICVRPFFQGALLWLLFVCVKEAKREHMVLGARFVRKTSNPF